MPAKVKRQTQIFENYKEFLNRKDKKLNGVSQAFADENPTYEQQNESNVGCYNCIGCTNCRTCVNCEFCDRCRCTCRDCIRCSDCKSCKRCLDARSSARCIDCNKITNCKDCKKLIKCRNLTGRKSLKGAYTEGKADLWENRYSEKVRQNLISTPHKKEKEKRQTDKQLFQKEVKLILAERRKNKNRGRDLKSSMLYPILKKVKYPNFTDQQMKELWQDVFSVLHSALVEGASIGVDNFGSFVIVERRVHSKVVDCPALKRYVRLRMTWRQLETLNKKYNIERKKYETGELTYVPNEFEIKDPLDFNFF